MKSFKNVVVRYIVVSLVLIIACVQSLSSQGTQASIIGKVTDGKRETLPGATVVVKNESTGFTAGAVTNANGEYAFRQLPLGSPYTVTVTFIGFGMQSKTGYSLNQSNTLTIDFVMQDASLQLEEVIVVANSLKNTAPSFGTATQVTANDIAKLPVNGRNFTTLTDLSPLSTGTNLSGQLFTATNFTIDGMTAKHPTSNGPTTSRSGAAYAMSMEAVREFEVITNLYDVTFGRSGGGTVSAVTKSGTNTLSGSAFMYSRADWLSSQYDIRGVKRDNKFSTNQYGFSLGGPIIKDRAQFFVAWDHQANSVPLIIADIRSQADELRYGISKENLDRFVRIAQEKYGVASSPQVGSFDRKRPTEAVFARIDWQLNPTNLLTIRNNLTYDNNPHGLGDNSAINLYETYGNDVSFDNSFLASLRSVLGMKVTNEMKFQYLYTSQESTPGDQLPAANIPRVIIQNLRSTVDYRDTPLSLSSIQFGGQRFSPETFYNNVIHFIDNMYYNTGKIEYTFGVDVMYTHLNSRYGSETNGRFMFANLDDFENMTPSQFYRESYIDQNNDRVQSKILNTGVYGQLQTNLFSGFNVMAGIRMDYADYINTGNYNKLLYDELGLRSDYRMKTFHFQPRLNINWDINNRHVDLIKIGAGVFASDINNYALINNMVFDGTRIATIDLVGTDVPTPDFNSYRRDPSTVPGAELLNNTLSTININGEDSKVPVVYKANLNYTHFFSDRLKMSAGAYMTLARNNYMYVDANMVDQPFFTLANEDNRKVFVPAGTIGANGSVNWMNHRKSDQLGRVLVMNSEGKVNQFAFVIDGTFRYFRDGEVSASYTWNDTKSNTDFSGNVANSATLQQAVKDDTRDLSVMAYSGNHFRHKVVFYGTLPTFHGITVGIRYSGTGGTRYSMVVGGNVSGYYRTTGNNNLAFIPDLNDTSNPQVVDIMKILNNPDAAESYKTYIRNSSGKIAERGGGVNGFFGTWDIRAAKKFKVYGKHAMELSADIFNLTNLLSKEWGTRKTLGNQTIVTPNSFDQDKKQFGYNVNANTGVITPSGTPWQIQVGLRYSF